MAAGFITSLFACPDILPHAPALSPTGAPVPSPSLAVFIAYALHRTRLNASVTFAALFLLQRLKGRFPAARGSSGHRLFISAFMIASKIICDDTYSNKSWCVVGQGLFSLKEINQMEREMCGYLEWVLNVPPTELETFSVMVKNEFGYPSVGVEKTMPVPTFVPSRAPTPAAPHPFERSSLIRNMSPASDSDSDPSSPSHSDSTSPASSAPYTPPQSINSDSTVQVAGNIPKILRAGLGTGVEPIVKPMPSQPFAFAAAAVW